MAYNSLFNLKKDMWRHILKSAKSLSSDPPTDKGYNKQVNIISTKVFTYPLIEKTTLKTTIVPINISSQNTTLESSSILSTKPKANVSEVSRTE